MASNCTSCEVAEDRSVYWSPSLYFRHDNGSYELVQTAGGMTVYVFPCKQQSQKTMLIRQRYYFNDNVGFVNDSNGNLIPAESLTAFPPNFRMVAGNTSLRNFPYPIPDPPMSEWTASDMTQAALGAKAIGFNCLNYTNGYATEGAMDYHYLRNKTFLDAECLDGVRFELEFPSCWDGVRLDSEDHKSHILYPDLIKTGECPDGFNARTPVMFFETIWQTYDFVNQSGIFVIANGDTEGFGYHGDFYSGWNQSFLQGAVDRCTNGSGLLEDCDMFTLQDDSVSTSCFLAMPQELRQEDYQGPMPALPGNVPIFTGPGLAAKLEGTPVTSSSKPRPPTTLPSSSTVAANASGAAPSATALSVASNAPAQASGPPVSSSTPPVLPPDTISAPKYPATTPAPSTDDNEPLSILTTSTFTSDGHEVHLVIFEDVMTVTDFVGPAKRHIHKHAYAHAPGRG